MGVGTGSGPMRPGTSMKEIHAACWQAARPLGEYSFLGCDVAPGFEFQDFEMLTKGSKALAHITSLRADLAELD